MTTHEQVDVSAPEDVRNRCADVFSLELHAQQTKVHWDRLRPPYGTQGDLDRLRSYLRDIMILTADASRIAARLGGAHE